VDVPAARFVDALKESGATVLGLSGLLTLAFESMKETVRACRLR
jgi:5-methyltetrahydrofolate--homocysteine methyltransferase